MADEFVDSVRRAIQRRGASVRSVARDLSYDHAYLSRVLSGKQSPSPQLAASLDAYLGAEGAVIDLAASLTGDARERIRRAADCPTRIDGSAVGALSDVLAAQRRLDDVLGPVPMLRSISAQAASARELLREARGPHRAALADVVAEWVQFEGWLYASARDDGRAKALLDEALDLADESGSPVLTAQALNFRGYVSRQQGRPVAVARWFLAAYQTPGAHPAQRMGDAAQAAQGYAELGQRDEARRLLDEAANLADAAADQPPDTAYWLTPSFQRLNLGLAHLALGEPADAAEHIRGGLAGLPADQQGAEWSVEYREALQVAEAA
ncbi:helix-turn-helix domain-containing protein [Streptomyces griseus]|uniref:helix-turn-helix domain-containing protein n=1 Tax=Streptomyces griseus TaxID=1911 RepID=UPI0038118578